MDMHQILRDALRAGNVDVQPTKTGWRPDSKYTHADDLFMGVLADESGFFIGRSSFTSVSPFKTASYDLGVEAAAKDLVNTLRSRLGFHFTY